MISGATVDRAYACCDSRSTSFQAIIDDLLVETGASRTTLRFDAPGEVFPVAAEALADGVRSIRGDGSIDIRGAAPFVFIESERRPLVQEDVYESELAPPPELLSFYGVRAQMLAPLFDGEPLIGVISVHYVPGPRPWTEADRAALDRAVERVYAEL